MAHLLSLLNCRCHKIILGGAESNSNSENNVRKSWKTCFKRQSCPVVRRNSATTLRLSHMGRSLRLFHQILLEFLAAMYSKQIVLQWIPGQCGVTGNEFAENVAKKGASIQQITRKADPFTSAKCVIKKKLNDISS
ncbi:hypothetical protein TNCV_2656351 [Trichonephila clavipes]|nr:hypothetical protein TNCV_2656351 [Trichonephila clavipes]